MSRKNKRLSRWQKAFILLVALVGLLVVVGFRAEAAEAGDGDDSPGYVDMKVTGVKPDIVTCLSVVKRCSAAFTIRPKGTGRTYIGYASGWGLSMNGRYTLSGRFWDDGRVSGLRIVN